MADEHLGALRPSRRHEITLLSGETVFRMDPVHVSADTRDNMLTGGYTYGQLAVMLLSNRRVAYLPPDLGLAFMLRANLSESRQDIFPTTEHIARALGKVRSYDLATIVRFWSWQPEFSAPPAMQVGRTELIRFDLQIDQYPWGERASIDAIREHFSATTAAWGATRSRAISHNQQP